MKNSKLQIQIGTAREQCDCHVSVVPIGPTTDSRYQVELTITSPDRVKDNPIRVLMSADHAVRLIKELAISVLSDMK